MFRAEICAAGAFSDNGSWVILVEFYAVGEISSSSSLVLPVGLYAFGAFSVNVSLALSVGSLITLETKLTLRLTAVGVGVWHLPPFSSCLRICLRSRNGRRRILSNELTK